MLVLLIGHVSISGVNENYSARVRLIVEELARKAGNRRPVFVGELPEASVPSNFII